MPRATTLAGRLLFGVVIAMAPLSATTEGHAQRAPVRVAVGEIEAARPALADELSGALEDALREHDDVRLTTTRGAELVLRGSLVSVERRRVDRQLEVRCEISLIVADARGGAIRAMLRGRAGARGGDPRRLYENALRAAVRGALRRLATHGRSLARAR